MKHIFRIVLMCLCCAACLSCAGFVFFERYNPGRYEGEAAGYRGKIRVLVHTNALSILNVELLDNAEDDWVGGAAIEELLVHVLDNNTTNIDAVSGATQSSEGFLAAVEDALFKARRRTPARPAG
ncbi:MAG: FMN-binding protein [Spirochaetaceae bacterium]|jgi:uncharacterized protein with FMN-binding domain|nr:FMN-binding protein [Spirochaetaceae bacterium]